HGRIKDLKEPVAAFIRLAEPVRFDATDGRAANLLFILLVPETATQTHLELLAEIARLMSDADIRHALATETDPAIVHRILTSLGTQEQVHADAARARKRQRKRHQFHLARRRAVSRTEPDQQTGSRQRRSRRPPQPDPPSTHPGPGRRRTGLL